MAEESTIILPGRGRLRRFRVLGIFVIGLIAFDLLILSFQETWERHSPDEYAERVRGCRKQRRDVVFVGGSTVAEGIDPGSIMGIVWRGTPLYDAYAVGLSGGTTSDIYFAVTHACPTPPKLLVYGITASDINDSRHEPHGPHSLMDRQDVRDWRETRPDAAEWVTRHYLRGKLANSWATMRYRHGIRMWAASEADSLVPGSCPETMAEARRQLDMSRGLRTGNGYVPTQWFASRAYSTMKTGGWVAPPFEYLARYRTGSHLKYLHRLIDWCEAHGTTLVLVDMPRTTDLEQRHPTEFAEYQQRLIEISRERNVLVLRADSARTGLDDRHFADLIHMNREGAMTFSAWLRAELTAMGKLPDEQPTEPSGVAQVGGRK